MRANSLQALINQTKDYLDLGVYDPEHLFALVYPLNRPVHYATVRQAIHLAKVQ